MSSSESDPPPESQFGKNLQTARTTLRRSDLRTRLGEVAGTLRRYLLLAEVHEVLTNEPRKLEAEVHDQISDLRDHIENQDFDAIETELDSLESRLTDEVKQIERVIEEHSISVGNTMDAMEKLNERVGNIDPDRITELQARYDALAGLGFVEGESFEDELASVERTILALEAERSSIQEEVFGQFYGTDLEEVVRQLLNDESFRINNLTTDQFERLQRSALADCLEVLLS